MALTLRFARPCHQQMNGITKTVTSVICAAQSASSVTLTLALSVKSTTMSECPKQDFNNEFSSSFCFFAAAAASTSSSKAAVFFFMPETMCFVVRSLVFWQGSICWPLRRKYKKFVK